MRRYFYKARHSAPREAHRALGYFRQLYMLERELAEVPDTDRREQRQLRALPLLETFRAWLDELAPSVVPKTELAAAVGYPRPLIEVMRDPSRLDPAIVADLTSLLPDRWHDAHPQHHLEINRKTRLVGEAA